ncbi:hypothetical protein M885DRAFT_503396 [Pelagophyceae sp. CCMP2097]|nr:hypothetical protein M885DRAFT_503396 [Pelagophyceae sp. CCMP2097]
MAMVEGTEFTEQLVEESGWRLSELHQEKEEPSSRFEAHQEDEMVSEEAQLPVAVAQEAVAVVEEAAAAEFDPLQRTLRYFTQVQDADGGIPKYPILRYLVVGDGDAEKQSTSSDNETQRRLEEAPAVASANAAEPQSYNDALALNGFVTEFVAMLSKGFRVVKHEANSPSKAHILQLSSDCRAISWRLLEGDSTAARYLVSCVSRVFQEPPTSAAFAKIPASRRASCFALAYAPSSERKSGLPPRIVIFETTNEETKHLIVDGLQLLVERNVANFFTSSEFRIPKGYTRGDK